MLGSAAGAITTSQIAAARVAIEPRAADLFGAPQNAVAALLLRSRAEIAAAMRADAPAEA